MKRFSFFLILLLLSLTSCSSKRESADLILTNAKIYTVNDTFDIVEALVVKDGKIIFTGTTKEANERFETKNIIEANNQYVYPGFYDAHAHLYKYGLTMQTVNLRGTKSYNEVVAKVVEFQQRKKVAFIEGRGWDQNDWENKEFPTRAKLDALFPETPVVLTRIDGHAMLVNGKALDLAGITENTKVEGGQVEVINGQTTGILVDNAMELIKAITPEPSLKTKIQAFKEAQDTVFNYGITTINEAGLDREIIELIDSLQKAKVLDLNVYAMAMATKENLAYYTQKGIYKTPQLNVRSFKFMGDGALGSRGACLHLPYADKPKQFGALLSPIDEIKRIATQIANSDYQMNAHAIGDSTNTVLLKIYAEVLKNKPNRRWKIEHAQIMQEQDFDYFKLGIIPSVQPTHATSDMYWAEDRVGAARIKNSYAYKTILNKAGLVALGTDFPIEEVNPMLTFYAAVARKDLKNYPENGFQMENALTREETLKGMTIWAAYSNFEEKEKGSLEIGKWADFTVFSEDIMTMPIEKVPYAKPTQVFVKGKEVK
ncbi:amidohydrolase family protein [Flavobacterium sp. TP390]|uniref:Amidohydrolase family protein n=1 Tax=Flavobacterium profundi TaxID=1774945 RepID=A0A6I4ILE8_9FLAO|nr:amidohydrolase [Flavobacterium profundi]MVO09211.1 amidohydrolase family protein [Flavobacterium profundi]